MPSIEPTPEALAALAALDSEGPIVMINLLRFREQAEYPAGSGDAPCSGRDAYARYGAGVFPLLGKAGARVVWSGSVELAAIAPEGEAWDQAILVEYPSARHFLEMVTSADYQACSYHRSASLADSRLLATSAASD